MDVNTKAVQDVIHAKGFSLNIKTRVQFACLLYLLYLLSVFGLARLCAGSPPLRLTAKGIDECDIDQCGLVSATHDE